MVKHETLRGPTWEAGPSQDRQHLRCLIKVQGIPLAVQWLGLGAFTAVGLGLILGSPGQGTKLPHAVQCSQKKKEK